MLIALSLGYNAQSLITGNIKDSLQAPIPFATIALLNASDSAVIKGIITNDNGEYVFKDVLQGSYFLKASAVGYDEAISNTISINNKNTFELPTIILKSKEVNLNEVSVTVQKKLVEFKNGNITVNIEGSALAIGNSVYDLLSRMPGVSVVDDAIAIQGKQGVKVLIDGRIQQFSGQPLINLLKSINASSVEKIEILKNPPVKYDAAGSGFISVKTKKVKLTGFSGSANLSYQQGFYANKDGGLSLNYKGKSFVVFSNFSLGNDELKYISVFNKDITFNAVTTNFHQTTTEKSTTNYASCIGGIDWFLNKKNTIGIKLDFSHGIGIPKRNGNNFLSDSNLGYNQLEFNSLRPNVWSYWNYNINAEHLFDTSGTVLRFSFDYSPNLDLYKGDFENYFLDANGLNALPARIFKSDNDLKFVIYSTKLDFEKQLTTSLKMEAGLKANNQNMLSNFNFYNKALNTGLYSIDTNFTNSFLYKERIAAGYFNFQKQLKKVSFQIGVRGENTSIQARSQTNDITYTRNYFNLFPNLSVNYNPSGKNSFQVSYNRRIERPDYSTFNPYKFFVNLFVSFQGNPYMQPQYSNIVDFTHGYKESVFNTVSFSKIDNIFYGYPVQNDSTKESTNKQSNLKRCYSYAYSFFAQKDITKWWFFTFEGSASYLTFSGKIDGVDYAGTSFQYYAFFNNQFSLPKNMSVELNAEYLAPGSVIIYKNVNKWALNFALKKGFLNNKLNVVIGMNDAFFTMVTRNSAKYLNINSTIYNTTDTRRFKASLSYNFGRIKVQQRRTKSNDDEKARLSH